MTADRSAARASCLAAFESYYFAHYSALVAHPAQHPQSEDSHFTEPALRSLYATYCRGAAARLVDSIEVARQAASLRDPRQILDVTCFATTQVLRLLFPGSEVHACDKHVRWAAFLEGVQCRLCDLEHDEHLPYDDRQFDLVVFTETLEHIPRSPYVLLREMQRILKDDGVLLFSVPNLSSLNNRIKLALGMNILSVELGYCDSFGHFREYNLREVRHLLSECGFQVIHDRYIAHDPTRRLSLESPKGILWAMVAKPLAGLVPSLRPACLAVARKMP